MTWTDTVHGDTVTRLVKFTRVGCSAAMSDRALAGLAEPQRGLAPFSLSLFLLPPAILPLSRPRGSLYCRWGPGWISVCNTPPWDGLTLEWSGISHPGTPRTFRNFLALRGVCSIAVAELSARLPLSLEVLHPNKFYCS